MELDTLRARLAYLHDELCMTWRKIAEMEEFNKVSFGVLNGIYNGKEPTRDDIREALGLPARELISQLRNRETGRFSKRSE